MQKLINLLLAVLLVGLIGCSSTKKQVAHRDRYIITAEEIATIPGADNAWEVVQLLRPSLLERDKARYTGLTPPLDAMVYLNSSRMGSKEVLKNISNMGIVQIQYIDGIEATTRYGTDASGGIFFVLVKYGEKYDQEQEQ